MVAGTADGDFAARSQGNMLFSTGGNTERMRITSAGHVTVGSGANVGTAGTISMNVGSTSSSGGLQLFAPTSAAHGINFGDAYSTSAVYAGAIEYNHASNYMRFFTGSTERIRIDSSGRLLLQHATSIANASLDDLEIGSGSGNTGMTIYSGNTGFGGIAFADGNTGSSDQNPGLIEYSHNTNELVLYVDTSEAARFKIAAGNHNSHEVVSIGGVTPRNDITFTQQAHGENWGSGGHTTNGYFYIVNSSNAGVYIVNGQTSWTANSDERIKENITSLGTVLPEIANIR